jgi:hypothetical protein
MRIHKNFPNNPQSSAEIYKKKSISVFLEKAKSYDKIIEFLQELKNQYANITKL